MVADPAGPTAAAFMELGAAVVQEVAKLKIVPRNTIRYVVVEFAVQWVRGRVRARVCVMALSWCLFRVRVRIGLCQGQGLACA